MDSVEPIFLMGGGQLSFSGFDRRDRWHDGGLAATVDASDARDVNSDLTFLSDVSSTNMDPLGFLRLHDDLVPIDLKVCSPACCV